MPALPADSSLDSPHNRGPLPRFATSRLRALRAGSQRGSALILTSLSMTGVLGMGALAIDVAGWYQKSHQAQVASDAAALAAANCLADAGTSGDTCTSTTDTADAISAATQIGSANGATVQPSDVTFNTSNDTVTVKASINAPSHLATIVGINHSNRTATSVASWNRSSTTNTTTTSSSSSSGNSCDATQAAAGQCLLAFGMDSSCPDVGITLENVGRTTATGGIWSNSDLETVNADYNSSWGPVWYGNGNLCLWLGASVSNGPVFSSGPTASSPITTWPRDFRSLLACGAGALYTCNGPHGTPSYCTQADQAFGLNLLGDVTTLASSALPQPVTANQVYCAYGTGHPWDPSTWNGVMDMTANSTSTSDSFLGGEVVLTATNTVTLSPQLDTSLGHLLVYANDAVAAANVATAGSASLSGNIFAPNGSITASSVGSGTYLAFLEGQQVVLDAQGKFVGEGPQLSSFTTTSTTSTTTTTTGSTSGTDQLVQ